jgi:hypothetical protein
VTKWPQKELKLKTKEWELAKLENVVLILQFWGSFCHKTKFSFFEILDILIPSITYFKKKSFTSQKDCFSNFSTKKQEKIEMQQNKQNCLSKIVLDIFFRSKTT